MIMSISNSFQAILKKEEAGLIHYLDFESAKFFLLQYTKDWYNRKKLTEVLIIKHPKK